MPPQKPGHTRYPEETAVRRYSHSIGERSVAAERLAYRHSHESLPKLKNLDVLYAERVNLPRQDRTFGYIQDTQGFR